MYRLLAGLDPIPEHIINTQGMNQRFIQLNGTVFTDLAQAGDYVVNKDTSNIFAFVGELNPIYTNGEKNVWLAVASKARNILATRIRNGPFVSVEVFELDCSLRHGTLTRDNPLSMQTPDIRYNVLRYVLNNRDYRIGSNNFRNGEIQRMKDEHQGRFIEYSTDFQLA